MVESICAPACPDCTRRSHAATEPASERNASGTLRVPGVPNAWHAMQPPDLTVRMKSARLLMLGEMPFPLGPVPGNSFSSGTRSSENQ